MIPTIIFDLSEVLIAGLYGMETVLVEEMEICTMEEAIAGLQTIMHDGIMTGERTEDEYMDYIITKTGWELDPVAMKARIRKNFHSDVPGMIDLLKRLRGRYPLVLLSDHAREWVDYILSIHPFLEWFDRLFWSFELRSTKQDARTFLTVLDELRLGPQAVLFIDDNPSNIRVAQSVGIDAVQFQGVDRLLADLRGRGIAV